MYILDVHRAEENQMPINVSIYFNDTFIQIDD